MGKQWKQCQTLFFGALKSLKMVIAAMKLKDVYSLDEKLWPTWRAYSKAETLLYQQRSVQSRLWFFQWSSGCEIWTVKKAELWRIDAFELWCWSRLLRVAWTARRSNESILKEISLEGLMLKLNLQYFSHLMRSGKDSVAGRNWGQEEKGTTEDEMAGWHHWLRRESEWTPAVGDGQGGLACCNSFSCNELDTTEWFNWTV